MGSGHWEGSGYCVNETAQRKKTGGCHGLQTLGSTVNLRKPLDFRRMWNWELVPGCPHPKEQARSPSIWLNAQWKVFPES